MKITNVCATTVEVMLRAPLRHAPGRSFGGVLSAP
jgi:hypothetical protein